MFGELVSTETPTAGGGGGGGLPGSLLMSSFSEQAERMPKMLMKMKRYFMVFMCLVHLIVPTIRY